MTSRTKRNCCWIALVVALMVSLVLLPACSQQESVNKQDGDDISFEPLPHIDLDDHDDYERVNAFLGGFVSIWGTEQSFDVNTADVGDCVSFVANYCDAFDHRLVERNSTMGSYEVPDASGVMSDEYYRRVSADVVSDYMVALFGRSDDLETLSGSATQHVCYYDGYIYFGMGALVHIPKFTLSRDAEMIGDGLYRISFDVYQNNHSSDEDLSSNWCGCTHEQLVSDYGVEGPAVPGTADVRVLADGSLSLVSIDVSVSRFMDALAAEEWSQRAPADLPTVIETPYYIIEVPAELGEVTYEVDEDFKEVFEGEGVRCLTTVHVGTGCFMVACISDGWGWQGDFEIRNLGDVPALPGYYLSIAVPKVEYASTAYYQLPLDDRIDELASGINLRSGVESPAEQTAAFSVESESPAGQTAAFSVESEDEACAYLIERLEACGKTIPPHVECVSASDGVFHIRGYVERRQGDYGYEVTQFWYDVKSDGSIYDAVFEREVDPSTMS